MKQKNSPIPSSPQGDLIELTIDSLSYNGGRGVGRYEGVVVFVPLTAPEERVLAKVTLKKPRFWQAELVEVLQPSPFRRQAPCPVFSRCGGCSWQHIQYEQQIEQKKKILAMSLRSLSKISTFATLPFLGAVNEFHYRNRIQVQVRDGKIGFFSRRSHALVETDQCWISDPLIDEKLKTLAAGSATKIELAVGTDGKILTYSGARDAEASLFSQVNVAQNDVLKSRVLALINTASPQWIMDLYAGSGNLTFPLAGRFPLIHLDAVELSRDSVARARRNTEHPALNWHAADVGNILSTWKPRAGEGLVVLDPPRTGCDATVIEQIQRHRPKQVIYVSCNPATFARDAERLVKSGIYRLQSVQGLDMFPQTEHLELISSFELI